MQSDHTQSAEGMAVVRVLAAVLERLVAANSALAKLEPGPVTKFHALKSPSISIVQYLERIHKYACCSSECFILALIYIDRMIQKNNFLLTELNVHRVVITGVLLAAKFFDDAYYNNAYYAKVGGVLVAEMNSLEVEFLFRINFSLHVTPDVFNKYHAELISHAARPMTTVNEPITRLAPIKSNETEVTQPTSQVDIFANTKFLQNQQVGFNHCNEINSQRNTIDYNSIAQSTLAQITPSPPSKYYIPQDQTWQNNSGTTDMSQYNVIACEQVLENALRSCYDPKAAVPLTSVSQPNLLQYHENNCQQFISYPDIQAQQHIANLTNQAALAQMNTEDTLQYNIINPTISVPLNSGSHQKHLNPAYYETVVSNPAIYSKFVNHTHPTALPHSHSRRQSESNVFMTGYGYH